MRYSVHVSVVLRVLLLVTGASWQAGGDGSGAEAGRWQVAAWCGALAEASAGFALRPCRCLYTRQQGVLLWCMCMCRQLHQRHGSLARC